MDEKKFNFNIKDIIKSFTFLPQILNLLWSVNKLKVLEVIVIYIVHAFIPALSLLTMQLLLNAIQKNAEKELNIILFPLILYLIVMCVGHMLLQLKNYLEKTFKIELIFSINMLILEKTDSLKLNEFEKSDIYDKLRRAQNEGLHSPYTAFSIMLHMISQCVLLFSSLAILMYWRSWIVLISIIVPAILTVYIVKIGHIYYEIKYKRSYKERKAWYFQHVMKHDTAFKEIKLYNLGKYFINNYKKLNKEFLNTDKKIIKKRTLTLFICGLVGKLVDGFMIYLIVLDAFLGKIFIGATVTYIKSLSNVNNSVQGILGSFSDLYQNNLYASHLFDFLELDIEHSDKKQNLQHIKEIDSIEFVNVNFRYPNRTEYVLKNISFKIKKGETISIVGENGSGKSTLIKLICGFYDNYQGQIIINGIELNNIDKKNLSEKFGVIFQDFNRYELSCRENIALSKLELLKNDKLINNAIKKACADDIISKLPKGIDSQLGAWFAGGVQLSLGQWQKIAIARAFLRNADCYILDEPSSSLDPVSEREIFQKSKELIKDKISIFISHRLYNLKYIATRILVLKDGYLIEEGSHETLINFKSHYRYLYELQNSNENPYKMYS